MKKILFFFCVIATVCTNIYANGFIGEPKNLVKKSLEKMVRNSPGKFSLSVAENIIVFTSLDNNMVCETYYFNKVNLCDSVEISAANKTGFVKTLDLYLHNPAFDWVQVNDSVYTSRFEEKLVLKIKNAPAKGAFAAVYIEKTRKARNEIQIGKKEEGLGKL